MSCTKIQFIKFPNLLAKFLTRLTSVSPFQSRVIGQKDNFYNLKSSKIAHAVKAKTLLFIEWVFIGVP